jgi:hypothetical protein
VTYRPTEFQVNNSGGVECDIFIDPETLKPGDVAFFVIQQDAERITVSLECLEHLLACANELLQARRETRNDAHSMADLSERTNQLKRCTKKLQAQGMAYPRTCAECGLGPCRA